MGDAPPSLPHTLKARKHKVLRVGQADRTAKPKVGRALGQPTRLRAARPQRRRRPRKPGHVHHPHRLTPLGSGWQSPASCQLQWTHCFHIPSMLPSASGRGSGEQMLARRPYSCAPHACQSRTPWPRPSRCAFERNPSAHQTFGRKPCPHGVLQICEVFCRSLA